MVSIVPTTVANILVSIHNSTLSLQHLNQPHDGAAAQSDGPRRDVPRLCALLLLLVVGAPLNLCAFQKLNEPAAHIADDRMTILRRHLNFSDLFIIFIYTPTSIWWQLTSSFPGVQALCKGIKFLHSFSFFISSNVIVCIALNRALMVWQPGLTAKRGRTIVKCMMLAAWALSVLESLPQLVVYRLLTDSESGRATCVGVWNEPAAEAGQASNASRLLPHFSIYYYKIYAMLFVFVLPLCVCCLCYSLVAVSLLQYSRLRRKRTPRHTETWHTNVVSPKVGRSDKLLSASTTEADDTTTGHNNTINSCAASASTDCKSVRIALSHDEHMPAPLQQQPHRQQRGRFNRSLRRVSRDAACVSLLLVVAYVLCWTPYNLVVCWLLIDPTGFTLLEPSISWLTSLVVLNSVLNPLLYRTAETRSGGTGTD